MFFKLSCLHLVVTCVFTAPTTDVVPLEKREPTVIPIISQSEELEANGTFKFSYETGNGIKREETSYDKVLPKAKSGPSSSEGGEESDESNEIHVQQGSYSYTAPDGTVITVRYIADENGFRPIGDHLPKSPSVVSASSGRRAKTIAADSRSHKPASSEAPNAPEASQAPEATQASEGPQVSEASQAPEASKAPEIPKSPAAESRIADSFVEQASPTEALLEPSTPEASLELTTAPEAPTTESVVSTTEAAISTTEQAASAELTTTEAAVTPPTPGSFEQLTTAYAASTPKVSSEQPTTTEAVSTPESSPEPSTPQVSSEAASELSNPQEPDSTPAEEPPIPVALTAASSEVTTEVASTPSA